MSFNMMDLLNCLDEVTIGEIDVVYNDKKKSFKVNLLTKVQDFIKEITGTCNTDIFELQFSYGWILQQERSLRCEGVENNTLLYLFEVQPVKFLNK